MGRPAEHHIHSQHNESTAAAAPSSRALKAPRIADSTPRDGGWNAFPSPRRLLTGGRTSGAAHFDELQSQRLQPVEYAIER